MAAYQAEATIADSIGSVLQQTVSDWELVVVDDGSTDGTAAAVERTGDARVRLLRIDHVGILGAVRDRGIEAAHGSQIAFLDADDLWMPEKLERQLELLATRPEVGIVHTGYTVLTRDEHRLGSRPENFGSTFEALLHGNFVCSSSVLVRRSLLDEHGTFDERPELRGSPDYDLWLRLALVTEFGYLPEPLTIYRVHPEQMSADPRRMNEGALVALELARERAPDAVAAHAAVYYRTVGILRCSARRAGRGRGDLLRALAHRPTDRLTWSWLARAVFGEGVVRRLGDILHGRRRSPRHP